MDPPPDLPDRLGRPRLVDGSGGGLTGRLERWAADGRVDEAARVRSRERWLHRQAEEEGTFAGVLADLLEAGTPVLVHTRSGGRYAGSVRAVGRDFVALGPDAGQGRDALIALRSVASVRTRPGSPGVIGDRRAAGTMRLAEVVAGLAGEREPVRLVTVDGEAVVGTVRSVGQDLVAVRGAGETPATAYLPLDAIGEIVVGG